MSARTDFERLESIQKAFSKAVKDNFRAEYNGNAMAEFNRKLGGMEYLKLGLAKLRYGFTAYDAFEHRSRRLMDYCEKTVPPLLRAFGEAALLKAIPPDARNEADAALAEKYGAPQIALLIRKAM
ncbi:MAG TPA: hypothetical protein VIF12_06985 [Micavibrio sp.]